MTRWLSYVVLILILCGAACGGGSSDEAEVSITIDPTTATVILNGTQQFTATVTDTTDTSVAWSVNDIIGGNSTLGTISTLGLYTAPANALNPSTVTVTVTSLADTTKSAIATVTIDSGATVTVSPSSVTAALNETVQFTATVTSSPNTAVDWLVNNVLGGDSTFGSISNTGLYTAPALLPGAATVTITARLQADGSREGTATVTLIEGSAPTLRSITPSTVAQGSLFQDVYLSGGSFLSTSMVRVDGDPVFTQFMNANTLRARIPASHMTVLGSRSIDVQQQNGALSAALNLSVVPVRPAVVASSPDSAAQGGGSASIELNGGFFSPSVSAEFNSEPRSATISDPRRLNVVIGPDDLSTAGLYAVTAQNNALPDQIVATNLAVPPTDLPALLITLRVGSGPFAAAVNPATGMAIVANRSEGSISLVDMVTATVVGSPIPVGALPTGVAIDPLRNVAWVVNNGSNSISVLDLSTTPPTEMATINTQTSAPCSVAVNPLTGLGVVVYQNSSVASIIDLATNTILREAAVTTTGPNPRVGIEPRLNWAVVTPGGAGTVSIVDLTRLGRTAVSTIASTRGAVRASDIVTITTVSAHGVTVGQTVTISDVDDSTFNGTFVVQSVRSSTSFTYNQTGADAESGSGTVSSLQPLATITLNPNVRAIGLNTETDTALLVDPTSTSVTLFSLLDQRVNTFALEASLVDAAVNPLTNVGVVINSASGTASVLDMGTPRLVTALSVGVNPQAVVIDPITNRALVVNEGNNDVAIIELGNMRSLHLTLTSPIFAFTSGVDLTLDVVGGDFPSGSVVRLDRRPVATTFQSSRRLQATIPAAFLAEPRNYTVDVQSPAGEASNVSLLTVMQAVNVGTAPRAVAIDPERNLALVTNGESDDVSIVSLNLGSVIATLPVGENPQGVAVLSRAGRAVVTNRDSATATILDLPTLTVSTTVNVGTSPVGVAVHPGTGQAIVANTEDNTLSVFSVDSPTTPSTLTVDARPVAMAIDPTRNLAVVVHATANNAMIVDLETVQVRDRITGFQFPTGALYDPASDRFVVVSSLTNNVALIDPSTNETAVVRVGINPTSIAYNYLTSTFASVNSASQTVSVMDFITQQVKFILPLTGSLQFSLGIDPRTNLAVIADETNHRVLLVPLPR